MSSISVAVDQGGTRGVAGLHQRGFGGDRDRLGQLTDFERDRSQRDALGGAQHDALLLVGFESLHAHGQVVGAGEEIGELEGAVSPSDRFASLVRAGF